MIHQICVLCLLSLTDHKVIFYEQNFQRMGEETPPVQKTAKQLEKEAKKAAEKAAKLEKLAAKQAKQVSHNITMNIFIMEH